MFCTSGCGLIFTAKASYLKERTEARINVMSAMTRNHAGATYSVLRLFYVQAVCALVDYSAPVLVALSSKGRGHSKPGHERQKVADTAKGLL